jgi:hypothetical protein
MRVPGFLGLLRTKNKKITAKIVQASNTLLRGNLKIALEALLIRRRNTTLRLNRVPGTTENAGHSKRKTKAKINRASP